MPALPAPRRRVLAARLFVLLGRAWWASLCQPHLGHRALLDDAALCRSMAVDLPPHAELPARARGPALAARLLMLSNRMDLCQRDMVGGWSVGGQHALRRRHGRRMVDAQRGGGAGASVRIGGAFCVGRVDEWKGV